VHSYRSCSWCQSAVFGLVTIWKVLVDKTYCLSGQFVGSCTGGDLDYTEDYIGEVVGDHC